MAKRSVYVFVALLSWIVILNAVARAETVVDKPGTAPTTQTDDYSDPCSYGSRQLTTERCAQWRAAIAAENAAWWTSVGAGLTAVGALLSLAGLIAVYLAFRQSVESNRTALAASQTAKEASDTAKEDLYYNHPPKLLVANAQMWEANKGQFAADNVIPQIRKGLMIQGGILLLNAGPGTVTVEDANCFFHWGPFTMNKPQWTEQQDKENWPYYIDPRDFQNRRQLNRTNPTLVVGTHHVWLITDTLPAPSDDSELYLSGSIGYVDARFPEDKRIRHGVWFTWKYDAERQIFVECKDHPEFGGSH